MARLDGKVAIVTGAARGQGAAEARLFASEGARVLLCDVLDDAGKSLAAEIGARALYTHLDVSDESGWRGAVELAERQFGAVNVLVNNAGIVRVAPLEHTSLDDYMEVIRVNQVGVFLGIRSIIASMKRAGGGSIVNISSIDGLVGMALGAAYVSSKFAVRGLTKTAALELGPLGIRVNSIHPGGVDTPMVRGIGVQPDGAGARLFANVPLGRIGQPEEIAKLALFLASDESSYSTGSEFIVDGGLTAGFRLEQYTGS